MSQFYDQASLVMVPSGYKDGKLYSQKPLSTSGELAFSRGSDIEATRVNSQGYIEKAKVNLLLQSNTFSTTWATTSATVTSGQAGYDGTNDAWLLDSTGGFLQQSIVLSGVYTFSVYAKKGSLDGIRLRIDAATDANCYIDLNDGSEIIAHSGVALSVVSVGSGWYRIAMTINDAAIANVRFYPINLAPSSATGTIYIQDAQLNYGLVAQEYQETTTAAVVTGITNDMPRLNYDPANPTCPSLILEPSRTNAMLHSEYIGPYFFYTNASANNNQTTSPEGVTNAASLVPDATSGLHQIASSNITASGAFTLSAFVKAGELNKVAIRESNATGAYASFNLSTGTKIEDNVSGAAFIEAYSNGWYRIGVTYTYSGNIRLGLNALSNSYTTGNPSSGTTYWSSNGTDKLYIYGLQCELGASYASSLIPCYGTSATRTADACTKTGISSLIGQTEGTLFVEMKDLVWRASAERLIGISDGTTQNRIILLTGQTSNALRVIVTTGNVLQTSTTLTGTFGNVKMALAYSSAGGVLYANGSAILSFGAISVPSCSALYLQTVEDGTSFPADGKTAQALLFKTRLSNADLATLTA